MKKPYEEMTDDELAEKTEKHVETMLKELAKISALHLDRKPCKDMTDANLAEEAKDISNAARDGAASNAALLTRLADVVAAHLRQKAEKPNTRT